MSRSRRVVIDPNVFVSAAITARGATAAVIDLIDAGVVVPIVCPTLVDELAGVLSREKFRAWIGPQQVAAFIAELQRMGERVEDPSEIPRVSSDPDDDYLFALAREFRADALVSGDSDLTDLTVEGLAVLTPRQLLDAVAADLE